MGDSQVKAFYKFKGLVAEKHTSGQYLTDWVSAWKIMVIASIGWSYLPWEKY